MRTLLAGELTQAQDENSDYYVKLEVQNGSGTWIDVGAALGKHWIINATWGENVDTTVSQATFTLVQRIGAPSLAPLMSTSVLNVDDAGHYAPLLDIGRLVRASTATMPHGAALDTSKYRKMFDGRIDDVSGADSADQFGPITIPCSDSGGWLMDMQIETADVVYGSTAGIALETVLQTLLTNNIPAGEPAVTLVKESASSFAVTTFKQPAVKVMEALAAFVLDSTGEDIRYRYDASHVAQLMWFNPDRTRVTVDATFGANQYVLKTLAVSLANVRNAISMPYTDATTGTTATVTSTDGASISKYRRRFNGMTGSALIMTATQAQAVTDAVAHDLSNAPAAASAEVPYFWPVQLYDRYTFTANNRQYDQDQTLSVTAFQHVIENGRGMTTLTVSGRIVGAYAEWLKRFVALADQVPLAMRVVRSTADDLQMTAAVYVADPSPGNPITITATWEGVSSVLPVTAVVAFPGDLITTDLLTTAEKTFTITRPEPNEPPGRVTFRAEADNRLPAVQSVDVIPRGQYSTPAPTFAVEVEGTARDGNAEGAMHVLIGFELNTSRVEIYATEAAYDPSNPPPAPDLVANRLAHTVIRHEGVIASADDWATEADLSTTFTYNRRIIALPIGPTGDRGQPFVAITQCVDTGTPPSAPPNTLAVSMSSVSGFARATLTWVNGDATAATRVWRNGIVLERVAAGVTTLVDDGLAPDATYSYRIQHIKNGQTTEFSGATDTTSTTPTLVAPTWAATYPKGGGYDSTVEIPPPNGLVLIRVVNPDPLAVTEVWCNSAATDTGGFTQVATIPAGMTDAVINAADAPGANPTDLVRWFYLVAARSGYTDSAASAHASATFGL